MTQAICPQHGPYDAAFGACPYCAKTLNRPQPPRPLSRDVPASMPWQSGDDAAPTDLGRGGAPRGLPNDETILPRGGRFAGADEIADTVVEHAPTGMLGWLVVKRGDRQGQVYKIKPGAVWGRDPRKADVVLDDEKVSAFHAKFTVRDNQFLLWDLGSANGTFVNDMAIVAATLLKENDEIRMGNTVFVLKILEAG